MEAVTQAQVTYFLTGRREGADLDPVDGLGLRPALFAGYRDLTQLRYDFPVVLVEGGAGSQFVQSLSSVMDDALEKVARGADGERIRKHLLRLEQEMRTLAAGGFEGSFLGLWETAEKRLEREADKLLDDSLSRCRAAIKVDGVVVDCDALLPSRLLQHAWATVQRGKAQGFRKEIDRLIVRLDNILQADYARSAQGRSAEYLQDAMGGFGDAFDFGAMSSLLTRALPKDDFPQVRRKRIHQLLEVLSGQRFIPSGAASADKAALAAPYAFLYDSCADALTALRERMPKLIELARAIAVAELEIDGQYREARHDALFEQFGANGLDPEDLAQFPDYLVCINAEKMQTVEHANLMEILSSGVPIKVLLQIDDILDDSPDGQGHWSAGMRCRQVANMAIGLNEVYVLQSSSSNLYQFRERVTRGLNYSGPALISVYSGAGAVSGDLPHYLTAAAAMESRAFPAFTYDPSAGPNWASRFYLAGNSQADLDWPVQTLTYEDEESQRVSEDVAFTWVDFVAGDRRYARHFARVPRAKWNANMIPVDEYLIHERKGIPDKVPSLLMVDGENALQRVIIDDRLIRQARRCREMWHSLQELGGIHNSHAEELLAREKKAWEERMHLETQAQAATVPVAAPAQPTASVSADAVASVVVEQEPERSPDEAYIETARCSSCDECTQISSKIFAYDANKQAYIADASAGTYAQLVEAAESCQVSVIHPGKPRNPKEPGLEDLLKRAEAFL
jgi:hypothetical protein